MPLSPPVYQKIIKRSLFILAIPLTAFIILSALFPLDTTYLNRQAAKIVQDRNGNTIHMFLSKDGYWRFPSKANEVPNILIKSVLEFEDQYYHLHPGINPVSIIRSAIHNTFNNRKIGASTISMQVARMMSQRPRTYTSKIIEMFRALQLEWNFSKSEIITHYFNLAPYGGNIEGVKTAAYFYFGKRIQDISISEAALLAIIPKNPNKNRPDRHLDIAQVRNTLLTKLYQRNVITSDQYNRAKAEPISSHRRRAIQSAHHFSLLPQINISENHIIKTTLDTDLQHHIEQLLKQTVRQNAVHNISNAAALIIRNTDMHVLAYVGSSDYFSTLSSGQNDGVQALRSPGSLLKPFIYAKALENGIITPSSLLFDIPLNYNGYSPENFDQKYRGLVEAKEALQLSLNVPAVDLNLQLGNASLYHFLTQAQISSIHKNEIHYGTSIVLGGAEMTLFDLTTLYAMLANNGTKQSPRILQNGHTLPTIQLLTPEAAYVISDILSNGYRDEFIQTQSAISIPKVAFKTGTSAALRDLWTIGYSKDYTVGIWMGNFDGRPADSTTGIKSASKPLFEIFQHLHRQTPLKWLKKPKSVTEKTICSDPHPSSQHPCDHPVTDMVFPVHSPPKCPNLSAEKIHYLVQHGYQNALIQRSNDPCYQHISKSPPVITSPQPNAQLIKSALDPAIQQRIMLNCFSLKPDPRIDWFLNGKHLLTTTSGLPSFIQLERGNHSLSCSDVSALNHSIDISIH